MRARTPAEEATAGRAEDNVSRGQAREVGRAQCGVSREAEIVVGRLPSVAARCEKREGRQQGRCWQQAPQSWETACHTGRRVESELREGDVCWQTSGEGRFRRHPNPGAVNSPSSPPPCSLSVPSQLMRSQECLPRRLHLAVTYKVCETRRGRRVILFKGAEPPLVLAGR